MTFTTTGFPRKLWNLSVLLGSMLMQSLYVSVSGFSTCTFTVPIVLGFSLLSLTFPETSTGYLPTKYAGCRFTDFCSPGSTVNFFSSALIHWSVLMLISMALLQLLVMFSGIFPQLKLLLLPWL